MPVAQHSLSQNEAVREDMDEDGIFVLSVSATASFSGSSSIEAGAFHTNQFTPVGVSHRKWLQDVTEKRAEIASKNSPERELSKLNANLTSSSRTVKAVALILEERFSAHNLWSSCLGILCKQL